MFTRDGARRCVRTARARVQLRPRRIELRRASRRRRQAPSPLGRARQQWDWTPEASRLPRCPASPRLVLHADDVLRDEIAEKALRQTTIPAPSFTLPAPRFTSATLVAIFTMWNELDLVMYRDAPLYSFQSGYVREVQVRRMVELVRELPANEVYCEIGLNGGHSLAATLLAHSTLKAHVFDLFALPYSPSVERLVHSRFGAERVQFHKGNSRLSLKAFRRGLLENDASACRRPSGDPRGEDVCPVCDMVFVDGDHSYTGARADLLQIRNLSAFNATIVMDDIHAGPGGALETSCKRGLAHMVEQYGPFPPEHLHNPCSRVISPQDCISKLPAMLGERNASSEQQWQSWLGRCARKPKCQTWGFAVARFL